MNTDSNDGDSESATNSNEDDSSDELKNPQATGCGPNKSYSRMIVDRSFTNLGYIGFGDGIDFDALDQTGNWQFGEC